MSSAVLPNMRLICLPSESLGEDWYEQSLKIDLALPDWGMDLAEEKVYLIYDRSPGGVMHGEGSCLVARSVIGPKRAPPAPFSLKDLVAAPVYVQDLPSSAWPKVYEEAFLSWEKLQREARSVKPGFTICIRRELKPDLQLSIQVIFNE